MSKVILLSALAVLGVACTENERARNWGGTWDFKVKPGHKIVGATWKGKSELWVLTRPMREGDVAETLEFKESSPHGILQGTVILKEQRDVK